jgi:hypothetical protein
MSSVLSRGHTNVATKRRRKTTLVVIADSFGNLRNRERRLNQKMLRFTNPAVNAVFRHGDAKCLFEYCLQLILVGAKLVCEFREHGWLSELSRQSLNHVMGNLNISLPIWHATAKYRCVLHHIERVGDEFGKPSGILQHSQLTIQSRLDRVGDQGSCAVIEWERRKPPRHAWIQMASRTAAGRSSACSPYRRANADA